MINLDYWFKHPDRILPRIKYALWEKSNPDKPWLCPEAVQYCEQHLTRDMIGLEYGSGRSTAWFADHLKYVYSIEHAAGWYEIVAKELQRRAVNNVDYRLIQLDHPEAEPEREAYQPLPGYVAVLQEFPDEYFDFILIDGHYRTTCIKNSLAKLKTGGLLFVDDTNMWGEPARLPVPKEWRLVNESSNGIKKSCIWRKGVSGA